MAPAISLQTRPQAPRLCNRSTCELCAMEKRYSLQTRPWLPADQLAPGTAIAQVCVPAERPQDGRLAVEPMNQHFRCDGCAKRTRNPLEGAFLHGMRTCPLADRETRWLAGEDATWMCLDCWAGHLERSGNPPTPDFLATHLGLPLPPPAPNTLRPPMVVDDRLESRGQKAGGAARAFTCDRCHRLFRETGEVRGIFLVDRWNRHMWSFDCVRAIVSSTGACLGLERSNRLDCQPPPASSSADDPAPLRFAAWKAGDWDASWMCLECAAGLHHRRPGWLVHVTKSDCEPGPDMQHLHAPPDPRGRTRANTGRRGGKKAQRLRR